MDFSIILQAPQVRAVVQDGIIERTFHDALFPTQQFRGEAEVNPWPLNSGDSQIFNGSGLFRPKQRPLAPNEEPQPSSYDVEQWEATINQFADTTDVAMPTSIVAAVDLFMRSAHNLGMSGGQALNRIARNRMYNAALSGWTVAVGAQNSVTTLKVARINGFTRARRPSVTGASPVKYSYVSASNPLPIKAGATDVNVIGYTSDTGDEFGPGYLLLDAAVTVGARDPVYSYDATNIVRAGGGNSIDSLANTDVFKLNLARAIVANFRQQNVPFHPDGRYHAHIDPISESQAFDDEEFQRLNTSLPDYVLYREFALGEMLGVVYFRNNEDPVRETVQPYDGVTYSVDDDFAGELYTTGLTTGVPVHRVLYSGQGGLKEYFVDMNALITEAGVTGKVADARIVNNGIEINTDRIQLIVRGPINRLQDKVSISWKFIGAWAVRTDGATGNAARFKRFGVVEHGA